MNHKELANQVLIDIKNKEKSQAVEKINILINEDADLQNLWGGITRLALNIGEISCALASAEKFLSCNKSELQRNLQVASVYAETGRFNQAIELLKPISENLDSPSINHLLGTIYSQIGNKELACLHLRKALMKNPMLGISWLSLASLKTFTSVDKELETLTAMETRVVGSDPQNDIPYWFAFGKALLDTGETELAYEKFEKGAQLANKTSTFNINQHKAYIDTLIKAQTPAFFEQLPKVPSSQGEELIFIIGLPRSGTTLLQQMLTCHPLISAGGESNNLAISLASYSPNIINTLNENLQAEEILNTVATEYTQLTEQRFGKKGLFLDKSFNINNHLGLLIHLFPGAKFINITRNKAENAWSCYKTYFSQGLDWSFNIDDIKAYFDCDTQLMNHWNSFLSEKITHITYEDLVSDPKQTLLKVCHGIHIDYSEEFTGFDTNPHPVQTASVGQVRGPLTRSSVKLNEYLANKFSGF